ncbi:MAG: LCP family protein [Clostridiales bacterium]|nr:LCP family protein [Clostridiales bacterium]
MKRKSPLNRIISIVLLIVFVVVGFNIGKSIFGDNAKSRLTDVTNILVAGVDIDGYRTDLILFVQVNNIDKKVSVLQIPRDTKVDNKRRDKKINSAYFSGIDTLNNEVESVIGMRADFFATITFDAFKEIVDTLGGVTIDVPIDMNYHDPIQGLTIELEAGRQKLDGEHAMMFMRFRKNDDGTGYAMGDIDRNAAQKQFYSAVMKKALSPVGIIKAPWLYSTIMENTTTDLNNAEVRKLMFEVFSIGKDNIGIYQLPGESKYINNISYFVHDKKETKKLMDENFR